MKFTRLKNTVSSRKAVDLILHTGEQVAASGTKGAHCKSLDYFKPSGHFAERFTQKFNHPKRLHIFFPKASREDVCAVFIEARNKGGAIQGRVYIDWWSETPTETFETIDVQTLTPMTVSEAEYEAYVKQYNLTEKYVLRLFFMLTDFLEDGIPCFTQVETRGEQSSIPDTLNVLQSVYDLNLFGAPFVLTVEKVEQKGIKKGGKENNLRKFPVLTLRPDLTKDGIERKEKAIAAFFSQDKGRTLSEGDHAQSDRPALTPGTPPVVTNVPKNVEEVPIQPVSSNGNEAPSTDDEPFTKEHYKQLAAIMKQTDEGKAQLITLSSAFNAKPKDMATLRQLEQQFSGNGTLSETDYTAWMEEIEDSGLSALVDKGNNAFDAKDWNALFVVLQEVRTQGQGQQEALLT